VSQKNRVERSGGEKRGRGAILEGQSDDLPIRGEQWKKGRVNPKRNAEPHLRKLKERELAESTEVAQNQGKIHLPQPVRDSYQRKVAPAHFQREEVLDTREKLVWKIV